MDLARFIAAVFSRCSRRFFPSPKTPENPRAQLGRHGEELAAKYLRSQGYKVLYRNFRGPRGGEVDLVCREKASGTLVFVEVKTRRTLAFGAPSAAVDAKKQRLIARGALAWLRLLDFPDIAFRFDIVEVLVLESGTRLHLIRNAFQLPDSFSY